ncbi:MAG: hypothetical protein JWM40_2171 [Frankiales bacterium]|nr:hypothetical protein [Frankiales bacterium]
MIVVAYNAAATLQGVLDRIPQEFWSRCAGVWVSDDFSVDETHTLAQEWSLRNSHHPLTVVRQEANLGYGGNQKAGYRWAIQEGLDAVVLLHGDGQYAPEIVGDIVEPVTTGAADVVLGSRMMVPGHARKGGMPLYKVVGNRILTRTQNRVTGADLSEWHSGYRAYRVSALAAVPFEAASDGFSFDTEILLQLMSHQARVVEIPIPTYYGDEVCHVNGLSYARDVVRATIAWRAQQRGFGDGHLASVGDNYAVHDDPRTVHAQLLRRTSELKPGDVLDLGCAGGHLAAAMREQGHYVTGVDLRESDGVRERVDELVVHDLSQGLPPLDGTYDLVVAADVLEHLPRPDLLLAQARQVLRPGGRMLISVPNVSHAYPRLRTALGQFGYDQRGILDATHLRFFTRTSFERMLRRAGLGIVSVQALAVPADLLGGSRTIGALQQWGLKLAPRLLAYQFLAEVVVPAHRPATSTPPEVDTPDSRA